MDGGQWPGGVPQNEDPAFITDIFSAVTSFLQAYGWIVVVFLAVIIYLFNKFNYGYEDFVRGREESWHKRTDGSRASRQHEGMERARAKMQADLDAQAAGYRERQREQEEKKRKEKISDWEADQLGRSRSSKTRLSSPSTSKQASSSSSGAKGKKKSNLKPDYNPLMGDSGASCYRPTRRGGRSGG